MTLPSFLSIKSCTRTDSGSPLTGERIGKAGGAQSGPQRRMCLPEIKDGREKSCIVSKIFIDTNIFVYAPDGEDTAQKEKVKEILKRLVDVHHPVISTQVIKEFNVVATMK